MKKFVFQRNITFPYSNENYIRENNLWNEVPWDSRVAWSILERLGRLDGSSNLPYPIGLRHADEVTVGTTT